MNDGLLQLVFYCLIPVVAMIVGGVAAACRPPGPLTRSGIQHFAAGVVFAVVAAELLPDLKKQHAPLETAVAFALGVIVMLILRWLADRLEESKTRTAQVPWGMLAGVGTDIVIDGILLGIGFAVGGSAGLLLTVALATELLSLGLAAGASVLEAVGGKRGTTIAILAVLSLTFAVGALAGGTVLQGASSEVLGMVLAFGCAALLYLVTEELLVEAHEAGENPLTAAMFFAGFLVLFLLDMLKPEG